jgi:DNA-binding NarL/FixJ family response regulator
MSTVALISDLFFVSKVKGTADSIGVPLKTVRTLADLNAALDAGAKLAIVDMNVTGVDPAEAVRACKAAPTRPFVIAYLSHVQAELAQAAQEAGADLVLPRSKFSADLPNLLQRV